MPTGRKIVCPRCDYVIALSPDDGREDAELICPNCGAKLRSPEVIEETIDTVRNRISGPDET